MDILKILDFEKTQKIEIFHGFHTKSKFAMRIEN